MTKSKYLLRNDPAWIVSMICFTLLSTGVNGQLKEPREILETSLQRIREIKTVTYDFRREERFGTAWVEAKLSCKLQESPTRKFYLKNEFPDAGSEVLWVSGQWNDKALVNPARFPYMNLKLDPRGDLMLKEKHHSALEIGFGYFHRIGSGLLEYFQDDLEKYIILKGGVAWNGRAVYHIEVNFPSFGFLNYTVGEEDDLWKIAEENLLYEQIIKDQNPGIDDYYDVESGDVIRIPNAYASKIVLYIDMTNFLPVMQEVHDLNGKLARYEYTNVHVNPVIADEEFKEDYSDYGF